MENLRQRRALWPWLLFYLLHAISYIYSNNKDASAFDLQVKLSILIFPIVIGTSNISLQSFSKIVISFSVGIAAIALFCLAHSLQIWLDTGFTPIFFYHNLVNGLDANAVYMSWYALVAISALLLFPWKRFYKKPFALIRILLLIILSFFVILLSSRLLITMFFIVTIPIYLYAQFKNSNFSRNKLLAVTLLFITLMLLVFTTKNPIKQRYDDILHKNFSLVWKTDYSQVEDSSFNNLTLRMFIWRVGYENIKQHNLLPYGAGNGDVSTLQNTKMEELKVRNINSSDPKSRSNLQDVSMHNMFLQSLMMLGLPGLILFILMMFMPFLYIKQSGDIKYIYIIFNIISLLFMCQESALQSQAGVVFFSLFSAIFYGVSYSLTSGNYLKNN